MLAVLAFILYTPGSNANEASQAALAYSSATSANTVDPLDTLSSSEIAATAAQLAGLPETTAIVNQADSDEASLNMIAAGSSVITKPQVVTSNYYSNKDIKSYTVENGDTLASVAAKFGLDQNTIKWSNPSAGSILTAGEKLLIPPVNGIVYTVKSGDTPASLATKYSSDEAQIIAYNDAEIGGLKPGEVIIIPGGQQPAPVFSFANYGGYGGGGFAWGLSAVYGHNGYDYGYCTWYVASQIPVPANWGNASTWAYYAELTPGWNVSSVPTVGSIAQESYSAGGAGHVAIVEAVNGGMIEIRDMNGVAGWGRVGTAWESISTYQHFISR